MYMYISFTYLYIYYLYILLYILLLVRVVFQLSKECSMILVSQDIESLPCLGVSEATFKSCYGNHKKLFTNNIKKQQRIIQGVLEYKTIERDTHNKMENIKEMPHLQSKEKTMYHTPK